MPEGAVAEIREATDSRITTEIVDRSDIGFKPSFFEKKSQPQKHNLTLNGIDFSDGVVEHVDHEVIAKEIGEFYGLSPKKIKEASQGAEIWILNDTTFNRIKTVDIESDISYVNNNPLLKEDERARLLKELQFQKEHMEIIGGTNYSEIQKKEILGGLIQSEKQKSRIIMRENYGLEKKHVVAHELIHSLGNHADNSTGLRSVNMEFVNTNEAATEILALAFIHRDLPLQELVNKIQVGEIRTGYPEQVKTLLHLMFRATPVGQPFTAQDLAEYYFQKKPDQHHATMAWKLAERARGEARENVQKWMVNDLVWRG